MFHGVVSTSRENDFTRDDIRATDASFKYGFFADPILVKNDGTEKVNTTEIIKELKDKATNTGNEFYSSLANPTTRFVNAIIYLIITLGLTKLVSKMEVKLGKNISH